MEKESSDKKNEVADLRKELNSLADSVKKLEEWKDYTEKNR